MVSKKERTMENYVKAGAAIRLLKEVYVNAVVEVSKILPVKNLRKFESFDTTLNTVSSLAEEQLYRDYPDLGKEGLHVFYGCMNTGRVDELDKKVVTEAKNEIEKMFSLERK